jgi:hypothetical protein
MALFITLGLISRPSAKMLSLDQHPDYAQHLWGKPKDHFSKVWLRLAQ